ncbi:AAA family ATPase [Chrysiogenes arsenatis]|uniref:AAA family ATPase n=1 Tax=Chrysiogenes arsenatis TaxID=309797 RepID=UPI0004025FB1|nr:AAA family ATPase [Chrysiogenes arsenatis]
MRILNIRLKNLNSLAGEWEIDLTHPAYISDGIFTISGPTGAGKTTILDALCLALYGRTPRLNKVTKSGNDIMSRHTGECFAEVTFETPAGKYCCHWSQHRSRKKPDGELQPPKHEIADANSGAVLETKILDVARLIESITGMDFNRFTRSMLLAQGGFAAFLEAAPDERSPILEQITGTEIYSQISIRVHECKVHEQKKLDVLEAELKGISLLSATEEHALQTLQTAKEQQEAELTQHIRLHQHALVWQQGIERLEHELHTLATRQQHWEQQREAFQPQELRLKRAEIAHELFADFRELSSLRKQQATARQHLCDAQNELPTLQQALQKAEVQCANVLQNVAQTKVDQATLATLLTEVRQLDNTLAMSAQSLKEKQNALESKQKAYATLEQKYLTECTALQNNSQSLAATQRQMATTQADESLTEQLSGINSTLSQLRTVLAHEDEKRLAHEQAERSLNTATARWNASVEKLQKLALQSETDQQAFIDKQHELARVLGNRDFTLWRAQWSTLTTRKTHYEAQLSAANMREQSQKLIQQYHKECDAFLEECAQLTEHIAGITKALENTEREQELLETQRTLLQKIESLEAERHKLQSGAPCPLCGSTEHPFTVGTTPHLDTTTERVAALRTYSKDLQRSLTEANIQLSQRQKDISHRTQQIFERQQVIATIDGELIHDPIAITPDQLANALAETVAELNQCVATLNAAEQIEQELATLRTAREAATSSLGTAELLVQQHKNAMQAAEEHCVRIAAERDALALQREAEWNTLISALAPYQLGSITLDALATLQQTLINRRSQWIENQKKSASLQQTIIMLEERTKQQAAQLQLDRMAIENDRTSLHQLEQEHQARRQERITLFGTKQTDEEEQRQKVRLDVAEQRYQQAQKEFYDAGKKYDSLQSRITEGKVFLEKLTSQLTSTELSFLTQVNASGFASEAEYQAALVSNEERQALSQQAKILTEAGELLRLQRQEKSLLLESEQAKAITTLPTETLQAMLTTATDQQKRLQQEIGALRQQRHDHAIRQTQRREQLTCIALQQKECRRWERLHELIGSADGKKYRNFAQGLTFEMMIGYANQQLRKMSDRYLLMRDSSQPLELNVIDEYQAGEIRSTKNLSGGEGFLVSLSLALGLSNMASRNVRVDSLFLDEGFGTLDSEALDTALETLAGLQQDGKIIGLISHIATLKERIATQIEVTPLTGGKSRIQGPGCRRVME